MGDCLPSHQGAAEVLKFQGFSKKKKKVHTSFIERSPKPVSEKKKNQFLGSFFLFGTGFGSK
jgi:hypothetical protein